MRLGLRQAIMMAALVAAPLALTMLPPLWAQQGPKSSSSETVARPRKKPGPAEEAPEKTGDKLESVFKKKGEALPEGLATFKSDVTRVQVDVAVLDNKGRFIPGIPGGNFRVLEDGVPQQLASFSMGEAPLTVALVIEFSNLYQQ